MKPLILTLLLVCVANGQEKLSLYNLGRLEIGNFDTTKHLHFNKIWNESIRPDPYITISIDTNRTMILYDDSGKKEFIYSLRDSVFIELNIPMEKAFGKAVLIMMNSYKITQERAWEEKKMLLKQLDKNIKTFDYIGKQLKKISTTSSRTTPTTTSERTNAS